MDIIAGLAAASNALGIAKTLRQIDRNYDAATFKAQITDLVEALSDAKLSLLDAKELVSAKETEIATLREAFERQRHLVAGDGDYKYILNEAGERSGFPIRPTCEAVGSRIVQLKRNLHADAAKCPVCATEFRPVTSYVPPSANGGQETTEAEVLAERRRRQSARAAQSLAEINNRSSWLAR